MPADSGFRMNDHTSHESVLAQGLRGVRDLLRTTGWFVAVHAGIGCLALALAAWYYARTLGDGPWALLGGWTMGAVYALVGFWGGSAAGLLAAVITLVASFERECRAWLERMAGAQDDSSFPPFSRDDLSSRTRELADRIVLRAIGRIPLPNLVVRLISSRVCQVLFDEFLSDCERRGVTVIRFAEVRAWLLSRGLALATAPLLAKLFLIRWLILGGLALLAAAAVILALAA
jgi:hypothetical protein